MICSISLEKLASYTVEEADKLYNLLPQTTVWQLHCRQDQIFIVVSQDAVLVIPKMPSFVDDDVYWLHR